MSELLARGWSMAEATLADADSERKLVTHWFQTGVDDSVNADDHFGSDERTLRFLGVALPTLIDQLGASAAIVAVPWDLDGTASLTVIAVAAETGAETAVQTRPLTRLAPGPGPPFWRIEPGQIDSPPQVVELAGGLAQWLTS